MYLGNVLNTLQNKIITLTTADTTPGRVIQDPELPVSASAPVRSVVLASSLALGLLLGLVLTFIRERRDPRIHTVSDIERGLGVPVLAFLPRPPRRSPQNTVAPPHTALGQAYLRLRNSLVPLTQRSGTLGSVVMVNQCIHRHQQRGVREPGGGDREDRAWRVTGVRRPAPSLGRRRRSTRRPAWTDGRARRQALDRSRDRGATRAFATSPS